MATLRALSSRLDRIEQRRQQRRRDTATDQPTLLPTLTTGQARDVLKMFVDAGGFVTMTDKDPLYPLKERLFGGDDDDPGERS
jgi:hypothetical protein